MSSVLRARDPDEALEESCPSRGRGRTRLARRFG